jgi:hypothetical protein
MSVKRDAGSGTTAAKLIVLAVALKLVVVNARLVVKDTDVESAGPTV